MRKVVLGVLLAASPGTDALIRTSIAPTMLEGSVKENLLPSRARAVVNVRILPGDSVAAVAAHVRRVVDDLRVAVAPRGPTYDPHPPSDVRGEPFALLARSIREAVPQALVAPALLVGTSDARYYEDFCDQVYGFRPIRLTNEDLARFHGIDERVAVEDLALAVRFFARLIENAAGG
jgi:carboxypeptidase PM20D1